MSRLRLVVSFSALLMSEWIGRPHILTSEKKKKKTFEVFTFGGALLVVFISLEENIFFQ